MLEYFVRLLRHVKVIEPCLNERRLLRDLGMVFDEIEKVMEVYENANILLQEF